MSKMYGDFDNIKHLLDEGWSLLKIHEVQYSYKDPVNFCQYWRRALIKPAIVLVINALLATLIGTIIAINLRDSLFAVGFIAIIAALVVGMVAIAVGATNVAQYITGRISTTDGIIGNIVKSHKENICSEVDYE